MLEILRARFGHEAFRAGQEPVIRALLEGRSALAVFPTGGGKSICYQLPALLLDGLTLVVSPLIALMRDQVDALTAKGISAARLDSTLDAAQLAEVYGRLDAGTLKLLYIAPERFANEAFRQRLKRLPIQLAAIDEAHCISEWGHNFRPDYLKLAKIFRGLKIPRVLCLTATATPIAHGSTISGSMVNESSANAPTTTRCSATAAATWRGGVRRQVRSGIAPASATSIARAHTSRPQAAGISAAAISQPHWWNERVGAGCAVSAIRCRACASSSHMGRQPPSANAAHGEAADRALANASRSTCSTPMRVAG